MIEPCAIIYLDRLIARLDVIEDGNMARYTFQMSDDRETARIERSVYDGNMDCIGAETEIVSLDSVRNGSNGFRSEALIWLARGMWGIPLKIEGGVCRTEIIKNTT